MPADPPIFQFVNLQVLFATGEIFGAVHTAAVHFSIRRAEAAAFRPERLRHGEAADGGLGIPAAGGRQELRRHRRLVQGGPCAHRRGVRRVRAVADGPGHVVRRARGRRLQGPRGLRRPPRVAPHPLARRPRRQGTCPSPPPRSPGFFFVCFFFQYIYIVELLYFFKLGQHICDFF